MGVRSPTSAEARRGNVPPQLSKRLPSRVGRIRLQRLVPVQGVIQAPASVPVPAVHLRENFGRLVQEAGDRSSEDTGTIQVVTGGNSQETVRAP